MTYRGEIEGRLDPYFYQPEFTKLEAHVRRLTSQKLRDFIVRIAGGSTPDIKRHDEYYTDAHNGVSFIRVQNLSPEGLQLDDCKYVTFNTHNGLLKRSQVSGGDLLVKITGVGRMAVSSVVHYGFEGNINQHIAAIKTQNYQTSEVLATFLNSDIGEKLASRRSTGGTRPALDYSALKSIPIIYNPQIVEIMQSAYAQKKQKEQEANALLDSIDDYVLAELGVEMPVVEEKKCFVVYANKRVGRRIDSHFHQPKYHGFKQALEAGKYRVAPLSSLITDLKNGVEIRTYSDHGYRYLRVSDLGKNGIENHNPRYVDVEEIPNKIKLTSNSFLISRSGSLGLVSVVEDEIREAILSSHIFKVGLNTDQILPRYLEALFRSQIGQTQFFQNNNGGVIPEISQSALKSISVVVPPSDVQEQIAEEAMRQRSEAMKLRQEADAIVEEAKREVERVMLEGVDKSP